MSEDASLPPNFSKPSQLLVTLHNERNQQRWDESWKLLQLSDLEENTSVRSMKTILLCRILYLKRASANDKSTGLAYNSRAYRGGGGSQGNLNYERMLVVMIPNAPAGNNIAVFLLGNGQNMTFWDANLDKRDTNDFSPGHMFVVEVPAAVEKWMKDLQQPLLVSHYPVIHVDSCGAPLPEVGIVEPTTKQQAFFFKNVHLTLLAVYFLLTNCSGDLDDALEAFANGILKPHCACYQVTTRDANISGVFNLTIKGSSCKFEVKNFTSKSFTGQFLEGQSFPIGTTVESLTADLQDRTELEESIERQISFWNRHGGYDCLGWVRRGNVRDQGVDQPGPTQRNEAVHYVASKDLIHHISQLVPSKPVNNLSAEEKKELEELKIDLKNRSNKKRKPTA